MQLPLPRLDQDLLRWTLSFKGSTRLCRPQTEAGAALTKERGENNAFFFRNKLGKALIFEGFDYQALLAINESSDRCEPIGLLLESRPNVYGLWLKEEQFTFTCNEAKWSKRACKVTVTPTTDDAYRLLLENYDQEFNVLACPSARVAVSGKLLDLAAGISIEFIRVGRDDQGDYLGTDGWTLFLTNTSWIAESSAFGSLSLGTRETNNILFRYRLRNVPMTPTTTGGVTTYTPVDKSDGGWEILYSNPYNANATTIDYVKAPAISGFKAYKIGTYNDWNDPRNPARYSRWGDQLLVVGGGELPSTYGYNDTAYIEVTGPDGGWLTRNGGGANNAECQQGGTGGGVMLNLRRVVDIDNCARVFWRFGDFQFKRGIPLLDAVHFLLAQTVAATGQAALLPPTPAKLSDFYSAAVNPATGDTGAANELPRLLVSAASDVKRYGASEPATRVLVSLKQLLEDLMALHDVGWFIDPATGWLRIEHRTYEETQQAAGAVVDLTAIADAQFPGEYAYLTQKLPRYEELVIASANTQDLLLNVFFDKSSIDYGASACVNTREGQNKSSVTSQRLTGDVTACVLSGDSIPDSALVLLTRGADGRLQDANRALASSRLLLRYHGRSAAFGSGTVNGIALLVQSLRPSRVEEGISVSYCSLTTLTATSRLTTDLGSGARLSKAELDLFTGVTRLSAELSGPAYLTPAPALNSRAFSGAFDPNLFL